MHCVLPVIKSLELMEVKRHKLDLIKNRIVTRRKNCKTLIREHSSLVTREVLVFLQENFPLITKDIIQKAEIIRAMKFVDANCSLPSSYDDSERFKVMLPNS